MSTSVEKASRFLGQEPPAILKADDIVVSYMPRRQSERIVALSGFSVSINSGDFVALSGRSGSGKTTALNVCAGLLRPDSGVLSWDGQDVAHLQSGERQRRRRGLIGLAFQDDALFPALTARENVLLSAIGSGRVREHRERADQLLSTVGLAERGRAFPHQLSGGQRQRVAVARALFNDPRLLLLDEPTASLDRSNATEIVRILVELRLAGVALCVASHDTGLVEVATKVIDLD